MVNEVHDIAGDIANASRRIRSLSAAANCVLTGDSFTSKAVIEEILYDILDVIKILGDQANEAANNIEVATRQARRSNTGGS